MFSTYYFSHFLFICLCFDVSFLKEEGIDEYLIFHATPMKWSDARTICDKMYNGTLLELNRSSLEDKLVALRHHVGLLHNTRDLHIWVNEHSILSPWYSYEGCFYDTGSNDGTETPLTEVPSFFPCSETCRHMGYLYFGIKVNRCHCYKDLSQITKAEMFACNRECSDNYELRCGSVNYISIYRFFSQADDDALQYRQCATTSCDITGKTKIKAQYCNSTFLALCENKEITKRKAIFRSSQNNCASGGGLHSLGNGSLCSLLPTSRRKTQYWIHLARYEISAQLGPNPFKCSLALYDGRQMILKSVSCRRSFQFACKTDKSNRETMCKGASLQNERAENVEIMYEASASIQRICNDDDGHRSRLSSEFYETGFIAIIVSCGIIVLWCCVTMICCCKKKKKKFKGGEHREIGLRNVKYIDIRKADDIETIEETLE